MRKLILLVAAAGIALAGTACSSLTVRSDYDREADFSAYRTYGWMAAGDDRRDPIVDDALTRKRIRAAVDRYLPLRGLTPAGDAQPPDLLLQYHVAVQERVDVWDNYGYRYGRGWYGPSWDVYRYTEGTLILDFVETGSRELVWRGSATGVVSKSRERAEARIDDAVRQILEHYPPR